MRKIQFTRFTAPYLTGEIASFDEATAQVHVRAGRATFVGGDAPAPPKPQVVETSAPIEVEPLVPEVEIQTAVSATPADKMLTTGRAGRPRR